jgi:integrase
MLAAPENDYGRIIRLLLLTGCRRDEIGGLRWSEVDLKARTIKLPGVRTKNGRPHVIPLSEPAMAILGGLIHRANRDLIFGLGAGGFSGWSKSKAQFDKAAKLKEAWTLHDLRRTAATRMADIGVQPHVIEALLNHISGHKAGVAGTYNLSTYAAEKKAALDLWASHLQVAVARATGANVTALRKK